MSQKAIIVQGIGKEYRLGATKQRPTTFKEALANTFQTPIKRLRSVLQEQSAFLSNEKFWALQDINFEVQPGEVVGLIGQNGAGKSTLLKVLSRITKPTTGNAVLHGRLGSLLEVGTGFHPDLTGRDNVYLNGTILGMRRHEIDRQFDEIVEFSEIGKFIDTQVKHYSSGMYLRLAFSVAAHLNTEILLVDEVLAVGDARFQQKSLGKMGDFAGEGRTVLFVSHNMTMVQRLCPRSIWLKNGQIEMDDDSETVVEKYLATTRMHDGIPGVADLRKAPRRGSGEARIVAARLKNAEGRITDVMTRNQPMTIEFDIESDTHAELLIGGFIKSASGIRVVHFLNSDTPSTPRNNLMGSYTLRFTIPELPLTVGAYNLDVGIVTTHRSGVDVIVDVLPFETRDDPESTRPFESRNGFVILPSHCEIAKS